MHKTEFGADACHLYLSKKEKEEDDLNENFQIEKCEGRAKQDRKRV
jgi:hypothetical protein